MEHRAGTDGPGGTEEAEQGSAVHPGAPKSVHGARPGGTEELEQAPAVHPGEPESVHDARPDGIEEAEQAPAVHDARPDGTAEPEQASAVGPDAPESVLGTRPDDGGPVAAEPEPESAGMQESGASQAREREAGQAREREAGQARESVVELAPELAPATGEARVDAALRLLDQLPELPISEHAELFEQVHAQLSDVLGELDSGPASPAGG